MFVHGGDATMMTERCSTGNSLLAGPLAARGCAKRDDDLGPTSGGLHACADQDLVLRSAIVDCTSTA